MKMKSYLDKIYSILINDESLLRLLYYKSSNANDDPLDPSKNNILDKPDDEKWELIKHRIKFTPVTKDLVDSEGICRIIFYPAPRVPNNSYNYKTASQQIRFDVFTHADYNDADMRLAKLCDYLNDLIFDEKISNLGKAKLRSADETILADIGYIVYSMIYEFGSVN